ncbi:MAG: kelch repeat-containing protein, partial [Nitrososphaerales archaeon]
MRPDTRDWKLIGVTIAVVLGVFAIVFTETQIKNADASPVLTWTKESPASSAPASAGTSMAYDQATGSLVLFGGDGSGTGTALDGTWLWTGSTWAEQSPATSPPARSNAAMAYDAATGDVVLFGGIGSSGNYLSDTWTWNGSNWTEQSPRTSPSPRADAAVANDQASGDIVLFGGEATNGQSLGDTWTWNGSNWAQAEPSRSPAARTNSSMAYDPATGVVVLFSGFSFSPLCCSADTWTWNGSNWAEQSPSTSPPAVTAATMIYDPSASEIVLFGGFAGGSVSSYDETWIWNG